MALTEQQKQASAQKTIQTDRQKTRQSQDAGAQSGRMMQPVRTTKRALEAQRALKDNQEEKKSSKRSKSKNSEAYTPAEATFFEPAQERMQVTMQQLSSLAADASDEAYWQIGQSLTTALALDQLDFVQNDPVQKDAAGFLQLLGEFDKIAQAPADTWKDSLMSLAQEFRKVNATGEAMSDTYLKDLEQQSPHAMFLYVQHCLLTAAQDAVDQLSLTPSQQEHFAQVYSAAMASGMIVGRMNMVRMQNEISAGQKLEQAAGRETQVREAADFQEKAPSFLKEMFGRAFQQSGRSLSPADSAACTQWALELWQEEAPGNYDWNAFASRTHTMLELLAVNIPFLELSSEQAFRSDPSLGVMKERLPQLLLHRLGKQVLSHNLEQEPQLVSDAVRTLSEESAAERELYQKRLEYLRTLPGLSELGDILENWITEHLLTLDMKEEQFDEFARRLSLQAAHNVSYANELLHSNLCTPSANLAMEEVKSRRETAYVLLTGMPAQVSSEIRRHMTHLRVFCPKAAELQAEFLRFTRMKNLNPRFYAAANRFIDNLLGSGEQALKGEVTANAIEMALTAFHANVTANTNAMEQVRTQTMLLPSSWRALAEWEKENIGMEPQAFAQALNEFVLQADAPGSQEQRVSYRTFGENLSARQTSGRPVSFSQEVYNRFMGADVCGAPVLGGLVLPHADTVLRIADDLMQQNRIPGCGTARCVADLANVSVGDYLAVTEHMRTALMKVTYAWAFTNCPEEKKNALLKRILPDLLEHSPSEDELQTQAKEAMADIQNLENAYRFKFLSQAGQPARTDPAQRPKLQYHYLNTVKGGRSNSDATRTNRRLTRLRTAYDESRALSRAQRGEAVDFLLKFSDAGKQAKATVNKLSDAKNEFLISGYEEALFRYTDLADSFTNDQRDDYEKKMLSFGRRIRLREKDLETRLKSRNTGEAETQRIFDNFHDMIAGLQEVSAEDLTQTQENEKITYNLNHFGVKSWEDAMNRLSLSLSSSAASMLSQEDEQAIAQARTRLAQISALENGLFVPVVQTLSDTAEVWQTLCSADETDFAAFMEHLEEQYGAPLRYLESHYSSIAFVKDQVLLELLPQMQKNPVSSRWNYRSEIYRLYVKIMTHDSGSSTIHNKVTHFANYLGKNFLPLMKNWELLLSIEGEDILRESKENDAKLKEYETRVTVNQQTLQTFIAEKQLTSKEQTGFFLFESHAVLMLSPNDFTAQLSDHFESWKKVEADLNVTAQSAQENKMNRAALLMQLEEQKQAGKAAFEPDRAQLERLQNARSLLLDDTVKYDKEKMQKVRSQLESAEPTLSPFILDSLSELSLKDKKPNLTALTALAKNAQAIYETTRSAPNTNAEYAEENSRRFLTYLLAQHAEQLAQGTGAADALREFQRARALVTAVMELQTEDPLIAAQRNETANALSTGIYRMAPSEFTALAERRLSYLKASIHAAQIWQEEMREIPEEQKPSYLIGLRGRFEKILLAKGDDPEAMEFLRKETQNLLKNETAREFLNSSSIFSTYTFDDLTAEELRPEGTKTRADFEARILSLKHKPLIRFYESLDTNARRLFALSLVAKEMYQTLLPSMRLSLTPDMQRSQTVFLRTQTQIFTEGGDVSADIDYAGALSTLCTPSGELDDLAFVQARSFTEMCLARRQEMLPIDVSTLRDSANTIQQAVLLAGHEKDVPETLSDVHTPEQFAEHLREAGLLDKSGASELQRLSKLQTHEMNLLILALQDRTMMDYTTKVNFLQKATGTYVDFVSPQERDAFFERYTQGAAIPAVSSEEIRRALETLYSYQLRDNILLTKSNLQKSDFVDLDRKTHIDWKLMSSALDFVKSIFKEQLRLEAIQHAPAHILQYANPQTKALYQTLRPKLTDSPDAVPAGDSDITELLTSQAQSDEQKMILSGILSMTEQQRSLFIKALGHRDILDISKADIWLNRFGKADRNYANPTGRNDLIEEYLYYCQGTASLPLESSDYRDAMLGMLSSQIDDRSDFRDLNYEPGRLLSERKTALDWKLIQRAVQLVYRTTNEKEVFQEDMALYAYQGDISLHGAFHFDGQFMRDNIHNAGNRFTRFFGRRVTERVMDAIPGAVVIGVKHMALAFLPPKYSNMLAEKPAAVSETSNPVDTFREGVGSFADTASGLLESNAERLKKFLPDEKVTAASEKLKEVSGKIELFNTTVNLSKSVSNLRNLQFAYEDAMRAYNIELQNPTPGNQVSEETKQKAEQGRRHNMVAQNIGSNKAASRQLDNLINDSIALITNISSDSIPEPTQKLVAVALEEAGHLINFIRSYFEDVSSINRFFEERPDAAVLKDTLSKNGLTLNKTPDNLSLIRTARGFEDDTEAASFVVFNVVRSLLFCAGPYNPDASLRILAVMTLHVLKMDDAIGRYDSDAARDVYSAISGEQYR